MTTVTDLGLWALGLVTAVVVTIVTYEYWRYAEARRSALQRLAPRPRRVPAG